MHLASKSLKLRWDFWVEMTLGSVWTPRPIGSQELSHLGSLTGIEAERWLRSWSTWSCLIRLCVRFSKNLQVALFRCDSLVDHSGIAMAHMESPTILVANGHGESRMTDESGQSFTDHLVAELTSSRKRNKKVSE